MGFALCSTDNRSAMRNGFPVIMRAEVARRNRAGSEGTALFISKIGTRITKRSIEKIIEKHAERVGLHNPKTDRLEDRFTPTADVAGL
jgi:site-specific recombinase XerD